VLMDLKTRKYLTPNVIGEIERKSFGVEGS